MPAFGVERAIDPLLLVVPTPLVIEIEPPLPAAVVPPAVRPISAPFPESPEPNVTVKAPAAPPVAEPVVMATLPDEPELEVPEARDMLPLTPANPASGVFKPIVPLLSAEPYPLTN
jgi:hypothetical protein